MRDIDALAAAPLTDTELTRLRLEWAAHPEAFSYDAGRWLATLDLVLRDQKPALRAGGSLDDGPWQQMSDAASPGPWVTTEKRGKRDGYIRAADGRTVADMRLRNGEADARFIVAAVNYVRSLLRGPQATDPNGSATSSKTSTDLREGKP